jgi:hypothetical protein
MVYANGFMVDADGKPLRHFQSTRFTPLRFAYRASNIMQQATFFRRTAFEAVGGFNVANQVSWDAELILDMSLAGKKLRRFPGYWALFRTHGESIGGSHRLDREHAIQHERMFMKVMHRRRRKADLLLRYLLRIFKWASEPRNTLIRAREVLLNAKPNLVSASYVAPQVASEDVNL